MKRQANINDDKKIYVCKSCKRRLSQKGDICIDCSNDLKKYQDKEYYKEDLLRSLDPEKISEISTKNNKYELKKIGKKEELALVLSYKFTYLKNGIMQNFEISVLLFLLFLSAFYSYGINNAFRAILIFALYIASVVVKNTIIKKRMEGQKVYFYKDKVEKISEFPFQKKQKILYVKIDDIKKTTNKYRKSQDLYIYEIEKDSIIKKYIEIKKLGNIDKIVPIIAYVTKFDGPEEYVPTLSESLKEGISEIKKVITEKTSEMTNSRKNASDIDENKVDNENENARANTIGRRGRRTSKKRK